MVSLENVDLITVVPVPVVIAEHPVIKVRVWIRAHFEPSAENSAETK